MGYAKRLGYRWGMTTNGMLLTPSMALRLKEAEPYAIAVSLDGLAVPHNQLRGSERAFHKAVEGIKDLIAVGLRERIEIISCVNTLNIDTLEAFVTFVERLGVPKMRLTPLFFEGRALVHQSLGLDGKALRRVLDFVVAYRQKQTKLQLMLNNDGYYGPEYECKVRDYLHHCGAGIEWAGILHDGTVTGATHISRAYSEGSIRQIPFVTIWEDRFVRYREGRQALFAPYCEGCEAWELCEGGGFHLLTQYQQGIKCAYNILQQEKHSNE